MFRSTQPLTKTMEFPTTECFLKPVQNVANHAQQTTSRAELAQFHHQSLFSPSVATLRKAIKNNQLQSFPGLDQELLKHLPTSTATLKGQMKKIEIVSDLRVRTKKTLKWPKSISPI